MSVVYTLTVWRRAQMRATDPGNMEKLKPSKEEIAEENRKLRMLRFMVDFTISLMYQTDMPREEALEHLEKVKRFALNLFPGKELAFELIYAPRLSRVIKDIYGYH